MNYIKKHIYLVKPNLFFNYSEVFQGKMKYTVLTTLLVTGCALFGQTAQDQIENQMLEAYGDLQYAKAKRIAATSDLPQFQLIRAMCEVFDRRAQNLKRGIPELKRLSQSKELPERYRNTAKLAYARAMHTLAQRKNVYANAGEVNPVPLYEEIAETAPETLEGITAVVYRAQYFLEKENPQDAVQYTEKFINSYKGKNQRFLCPLHLMLKDVYIRNFSDYKSAIRHAERARELVPATPRTVQLLHFQIARIYDIFLKDDVKAEQEYLSFLETHPDTSEATPARRYLKELRERKAK